MPHPVLNRNVVDVTTSGDYYVSSVEAVDSNGEMFFDVLGGSLNVAGVSYERVASQNCALTDDGRVFCAGYYGEPTERLPPNNYVQVAGDAEIVCALTDDNTLFCDCAFEGCSSSMVNFAMNGVSGVQDISLGSDFCMLRDTGVAECISLWSTFSSSSNTAVGVASVGFEGLAILSDGTLEVVSTSSLSDLPEGPFFINGEIAKKVSGNDEQLCILNEEDEIHCERFSEYGDCDYGNCDYYESVAGRFKKIVHADQCACGITLNDELKCWGRYSYNVNLSEMVLLSN